jgi:hypothetical protein
MTDKPVDSSDQGENRTRRGGASSSAVFRGLHTGQTRPGCSESRCAAAARGSEISCTEEIWKRLSLYPKVVSFAVLPTYRTRSIGCIDAIQASAAALPKCAEFEAVKTVSVARKGVCEWTRLGHRSPGRANHLPAFQLGCQRQLSECRRAPGLVCSGRSGSPHSCRVSA